MFKNHMISRRPKEDLILDLVKKCRVSGEIIQFLTSHQINGIRFIYRNVKNLKSCFLNDECGLGKTFQVIAVISALLGENDSNKILSLFQNDDEMIIFQYHCSILLPNIKLKKITDKDFDAEYEMKQKENRIYTSTIENSLKHLNYLKKINFRCSTIFIDNLNSSMASWAGLKTLNDSETKIIICSDDLMCEIANFYDLLKMADRLENFCNQNKKCITFNDFDNKFGYKNRSLPKRMIMFRQRNLMSLCNDFYLRRMKSQIKESLPLIDELMFMENFNAWKSSNNETDALDSEWFDSDMEIPSSIHTNIHTQQNQTTSDMFDDYESEQMSPLRYDSASEQDDDDDNKNCEMIEQPKRKRGRPRKIDKIETNFIESSICLRKKQNQNPKQNTKKRNVTQNSSDIQILTQRDQSPIVISSDSREPISESSPHVFSPIEPVSIVQMNSNEDDLLKILSQNVFSEAFPNQSTPIENEIRTNDTPNTFEITKNSAFPHRLQLRDGINVTPASLSETPRSNHSFTKVRVLVPKLNEKQISDFQKKLREEKDNNDIFDLTSNTESIQDEQIASSGEIFTVDKTPEKRLQLTPSTRSCVRSKWTNSGKSPQTSPWIKRRNSIVNEGYTPKSRRKLEKWFYSINNNDLLKNSSIKPRSILEKAANKKIRVNSPSIFSSDDD